MAPDQSGRSHPAPGSLDRLVEEVAFRGAAVLPGVLPPDMLDTLCRRLDGIYRRQCDEVGGEVLLKELGDADVVRCPLAYDDAFLAVAQDAVIVDIAKRLLGPHIVLLMQNGIVNRPGEVHAQTRWHRDLNHQYWTSSAPLAISILLCLDDFTVENGATAFLPFSQKSAAFPPVDAADGAAITISAPAGSLIVMDAMTFHQAGTNRSAGMRRAINHVIGVPILAQAIDIPAALAREAPADPWLAAYLGYRWNPARDARAWRLRKRGKPADAGSGR